MIITLYLKDYLNFKMIAKVFKHFSYENFNKLTIVIVQQNPIVCVVLFQVMVNLAKVSIKK